MFQHNFVAGWGDVDANSHMRNTAYIDHCADVRMMFFADNGFPAENFRKLGIGPVIMRDEIRYFREIRLLDEITVTLAIAGLAPDGSRFLMQNDVLCPDGKPAACIRSTGGWIDLERRKLVAPPADLLDTFQVLDQTDDFEALPSSIRKR